MAIYNKTKLYFFKLANTFFDRDDIDWIKKNHKNGHKIVLIYLELIAQSTNKNGRLARMIKDKYYAYSIDEIASLIKEDVNDVLEALKILLELDLIIIEDYDTKEGNDIYFIPEALEVTNQTESAKKKQEQRKRKQERVDNCPPEIDKEIEQNLELRTKNLDTKKNNLDILDNKNCNLDLTCAFVDYIENQFERHLGINEEETFKDLFNNYSEENIKLAIDRAVKNDKKSVGYVKGILEHQENGFNYQEMAEKNY